MKLALVTETFPPEINGVAMTFGVIARELGRRGHAVTVYRPRRSDLPEATDHPEYGVTAMPGLPIPGYPLLRLSLPAGRQLRRLWRHARPDLVHVATEGPLGASAVSAARALNIPVTSSFHTNFHAYTRHYGIGPLQRLALAWLRHVHNRTRRTFAPTEDLCRDLATLGFRDLTVLSRGVDTAQFNPALRSSALRTAWGAGPTDPVVVHAGRMAAEKNYPLLLRAFTAMQFAEPRLKFVLVGDGPLRPSLQREFPHGIFPGFIARDDLARHYASADIYVHASLTETFGNVLTEAMASGLAVAGFDYAAARQFLRSGENGLSMPCDQPDALISASVKLATNAPLRSRFGVAARHAVESQSWSSVIGGFENELAAIVAASRHASPDLAPALV